jgi:hypothetical protein
MRTYNKDSHADFTCKHCGYFVNTQIQISAVVNRNHCPYCLHSRHVDLFNPGDRLSACKALMVPVGLTFKHSWDKYAPNNHGELMLVHRCVDCGEFSINRIAADDNTEILLTVFRNTAKDRPELFKKCKFNGIHLLDTTYCCLVESQLLGNFADRQIVAAMV